MGSDWPELSLWAVGVSYSLQPTATLLCSGLCNPLRLATERPLNTPRFSPFHVIDAEGDRALARTPNPAAALASEIDDDLPGIAGRDFLQDRAQPARRHR